MISIPSLAKNLKDLAPRGFCADTRLLQPGDVYFALPGKKVDGHVFLEEAFLKGASCAVVSRDFKESFKKPLFYVEDVLGALQGLAAQFFQENRPKMVIAVTGSVGKTTTKEFLAHLLEGQFSVFRSPGNANSQIGLALSILNHFKGQEVAVLEMGMTHANQIARLTHIAPPDIALIVKVALVHAENFESIQEIAMAKSEIFLHPQTKVGIYDAEIGEVFDLSKRGSCVKVPFSLEEKYPEFSLPGDHNRHNAAAAIATLKALGVPLESVKDRIRTLKLPERRFEEVNIDGILFINDSYNASCDSMKAALRSMPSRNISGKYIGVLGGMTELGPFSEKVHEEVGEVASEILDHLICFGKECAPMVDCFLRKGKSVEFLESHEAIIKRLKTLLSPGDGVLIKGANSKKMWEVIQGFEKR